MLRLFSFFLGIDRCWMYDRTSEIWHCMLGHGCFEYGIGCNPQCAAQSNSRPYRQQVNCLFLSYFVRVIKSIAFVTLYPFVL